MLENSSEKSTRQDSTGLQKYYSLFSSSEPKKVPLGAGVRGGEEGAGMSSEGAQAEQELSTASPSPHVVHQRWSPTDSTSVPPSHRVPAFVDGTPNSNLDPSPNTSPTSGANISANTNANPGANSHSSPNSSPAAVPVVAIGPGLGPTLFLLLMWPGVSIKVMSSGM
jgi:hypothetical protein